MLLFSGTLVKCCLLVLNSSFIQYRLGIHRIPGSNNKQVEVNIKTFYNKVLCHICKGKNIAKNPSFQIFTRGYIHNWSSKRPEEHHNWYYWQIHSINQLYIARNRERSFLFNPSGSSSSGWWIQGSLKSLKKNFPDIVNRILKKLDVTQCRNYRGTTY